VNGSELVNGLTARVPPGVSITGGLSGDRARFEETAVLWDAKPLQQTIDVLGLYGDRLKEGYGSLGACGPPMALCPDHYDHRWGRQLAGPPTAERSCSEDSEQGSLSHEQLLQEVRDLVADCIRRGYRVAQASDSKRVVEERV
jgi:hypothetical protein